VIRELKNVKNMVLKKLVEHHNLVNDRLMFLQNPLYLLWIQGFFITIIFYNALLNGLNSSALFCM